MCFRQLLLIFLCFDSKLVRLKGYLKSSLSFHGLRSFRFQTGSIKRVSDSFDRVRGQRFDSKLVRLKVARGLTEGFSQRWDGSKDQLHILGREVSRIISGVVCFDSKLVRLKVKGSRVSLLAVSFWFRFQTGSIKSQNLPNTSYALYSHVSIPNWFD